MSERLWSIEVRGPYEHGRRRERWRVYLIAEANGRRLETFCRGFWTQNGASRSAKDIAQYWAAEVPNPPVVERIQLTSD